MLACRPPYDCPPRKTRPPTRARITVTLSPSPSPSRAGPGGGGGAVRLACRKAKSWRSSVMPWAANASPSATSKGARALPPAPWVSTSPSPDGAGGSWSSSLTRQPGRLRDPAIDHVTAIGGVGTDVLGPASFLDRLRPRVAGEHGGVLDLVERVVGGLVLDHDRLALTADHHRHRLALEARDRDDAGHLEQRRHVLGIVDLVEDGVLVRTNAHGGAE